MMAPAVVGPCNHARRGLVNALSSSDAWRFFVESARGSVDALYLIAENAGGRHSQLA